MQTNIIKFLQVSVVFSLLMAGAEAFAGSGITYHGRLLKPTAQGGGPVVSTTTQFKIQIRSPGTNNCLMYEELQQKDLSTSNGVFVLSIGDGSVTPTFAVDSLTNIFENNDKTYNFTGASGCALTNTYHANSGDGRNLQVYFREGLTDPWEQMPLTTVNFVPSALQAIKAEMVGEHTSDSLVRVEDAGVPGSVAALTTANFNELMALINGSSVQYTKSGYLAGAAVPATAGLTNGQVYGWNGSSWSAITPLTTELDPSVKAFAKANLPTCTAGQFLQNDGSGNLICTTVSAGGTGTVTDVSPATTIGNPITVTDNGTTPKIDIPAATTSVSGYLTSADWTTFNSKYGTADATSTNTANKLVLRDASGNFAAGSVTVTGLTSSGNVTASGDITGVNGVFSGNVGSDSSSTRNLGIANAGGNMVSLTAPAGAFTSYSLVLPVDKGTNNQVLTSDGAGGLLWANPSAGGLAAVTNTATLSQGKIWIGDSGSKAQEFPLSGDVTMTNGGLVTIANNAVTSAKINDKAVTFAKIQDMATDKLLGRSTVGTGSAEEISIGTGLSLSGGTLTATGTDTLGGLSCNNGDVPMLVAGTWGCHTPTPLATVDKVVSRDGAGSFAANVATLNGLTLDNGVGGQLALTVPVGFTSYSLILPPSDGSTNQVLKTDGLGNLGWTTITPGAGDFKADGSVAMTGNFNAADGSLANPGISFAADTDTGFYRSGANVVDVVSGGSSFMSVGGANGVQINTQLQLYGAQTNTASNSTVYAPTSVSNATPNGSSKATALENRNTATSVDGHGSYFISSANNSNGNYQAAYFGSYTTAGAGNFTPTIVIGQTTAANAYAERMRISSSGNVGIGTTTPKRLLDVAGPMRVTASALPVTDLAAGDIAVDSADSNKLKWYDGSAWQTAGGGGGGSGDFKADGSVAMTGNLKLGTNDLSSTGILNFNSDSDNAGSDGGFKFKKNGTDLVTILDDGRVGIGTTTPVYTLGFDGGNSKSFGMERNPGPFPASPFMIISSGATAGSTNMNGGMLRIRSGTSTGTGSSEIRLETATPGGSGTADNDPTPKLVILGSGNVGIGTTTPVATLNVDGAIVSNTKTSGAGVTNIIFSTGNVQVSNNTTNDAAFKICGIQDGGSYSLVLKAQPVGSTPTFTAYSDDACAVPLTAVDSGGVALTTTSNTTIITFIRAGNSVYAMLATGFTN